MTDVGKVQGPSGPPENVGRKGANADADKFKQAMRKRVTEVSKVDPDEQKKRKRREEAEEEENLEEAPQGPTTPASQVTPFSLETEKKKTSPLEMQKGGPGISPMESAQPTQPPPQTTAFRAPTPSEMQDDSGVLEEEAFIEDVPSPPGAEPPTPSMSSQSTSFPSSPSAEEQAPAYQPPASLPPQEAPPTPPPSQQPTAAGPPESADQQTNEQQQHRKAKTGTPPEQKQPSPGLFPKPAESSKKEELKKESARQQMPEKKEKPISGTPLEDAQPRKVEDTSAFFEQMGKDHRGDQEKKGKTEEELTSEEAQTQGGPGAPQPSPFVQPTEEKEKKKVGEKEQTGLFETTGAPAGSPELIGIAPPPPPESLPAYANLHPQVMELFDRMVGVMTVMNMSGMTETTITLNAPQFASSVFFGAQIIIQEFSTAPKAFNIQLNGNPQAVALFQGNADDLMAAFQAGNYNFRVNRLETGYLSERPLFKRKEKAEGKDKDQTGENP